MRTLDVEAAVSLAMRTDMTRLGLRSCARSCAALARKWRLQGCQFIDQRSLEVHLELAFHCYAYRLDRVARRILVCFAGCSGDRCIAVVYLCAMPVCWQRMAVVTRMAGRGRAGERGWLATATSVAAQPKDGDFEIPSFVRVIHRERFG